MGLRPGRQRELELSFTNNAVAVCFSFEQDASGTAINFTKTEDCPVPVDCIGHPCRRPGGLSGNYPATTKGDLDQDGEVDADDPLLYDLLADGSTDAGIDLNGDGGLSVTDVARQPITPTTDATTSATTGSKTTAPGQPLDGARRKVQFSLVLPHEDSSYVDVYVHNPDTWLGRWSLNLDGAGMPP